jgi:CRISPR-associated endoribonuclease Cas6
MRIKITLVPETPVFLPFSYYAKLSSAIYSLIKDVDRDFANMVHSGKEHANRIKLFGFSPLHSFRTEVHPKKVDGTNPGGLIFKGITTFSVCTPWPELMNRLTMGISEAGMLQIGSQIFQIRKVDHIPSPSFTEEMIWQPEKTAQIVTAWTLRNKKPKRFLMPGESFEGISADIILQQNIIHKWRRFSEVCPNLSAAWLNDQSFNADGGSISKSVKVKILQESHERPFINKAHKIKQSYVRSWSAPVHITAPLPLQRLIWAVGLGQINTMGFGMVREV